MEKSDDAIAPGWIDFWRLWRHCLCRFGWYPLFVAPLVTCACLLDIYSTTGCDFIRLDIGFIPTNDIWSTSASYAQLGLFSYDTNRDDENKWKRSFNNGCQAYSSDFESVFINEDQTWSISRILAYISGISSLVALSTAWLLTITPIPASFFWPGVLLPAVILAMLTGASKFVFFDTHICTEELWYVDESSDPVAAQSCDLGESSVFGVASVAAYFFCTVLICFRSPQKRELDENYGRPQTALNQAGGDSTGTPNTLAEIGYSKSDPEQGEETAVVPSVQQQQQQEQSAVAAPLRKRGSMNDMSERTTKMSNSNNDDINTAPQVIVEHGRHHTRNTSDVTWITDPTYTSFNDRTRNLGLDALSPRSPVPTRISEATESSEEEEDLEWNKDGHPIIIAINDSDGSIDQTLSTKSLNGLPPRPNRTKSDLSSASANGNHRPLQSSISNSSSGRTHSTSESDDAGSVHSRISRISFSETYASDDISGLGHYSIGSKSTGAPSVVQIPTSRSSSTRHHHHTFSGGSPGSISHSPGNRKTSRYNNKKRSEHDKFLNTNQQEHDIFLNNNNHHDHHSHTRTDSKRELITLPRLDESLEDHGDLINQCVRDLHQSFATGDNANGYKTL